jgi:tRNA (cmo5U34)-methyltransferase
MKSEITVTKKATVDEIRTFFDQGVERFTNLQTGYQAAMDSVLIMELLAAVAAHTTPHARTILDIGCGAGNYTLKLLEALPDLHCVLLDLSQPMLDRAMERVRAATRGTLQTMQTDVRTAALGENQFDIVISGTALHHLRADHEWEAVFTNVFRSLAPGGSFWISDLVTHDHPDIQAVLWARYGQYLETQGGVSYRERIFANIAEEDTPRSVGYQMQLLTQVGFKHVELIHKHACFAAFGGVKE